MEKSLNPAFTLQTPLPVAEARRIPGRVLAYIGDSAFELGVRLRHFFRDDNATGKIHGTVVPIVCAENQAAMFDQVFDVVSDEEKNLLRLWRNMKLPRKISIERRIYAKSTAFEAFIGYLFLAGEQRRIDALVDAACTTPNGGNHDEEPSPKE